MGISKPALRFIAIEHRRRPFAGNVLTLGRQCIYATFSELNSILREEGIVPAALPPNFDTSTNIPSWRGTAFEKFTSDVALFRLLGLSGVQAMDVDRFEGAEIVGDLNQPIAPELLSRFDWIVDSGTIEHVFDVRMVLRNLVRMLRPGGRILHLTPSNNFCNHGFYQFSPTCFADFYSANQFQDLRVFVAEEMLRFDQTRSMDIFEFDVRHQPCMITSPSNRRLLAICLAEKGPDSTDDRIPTQSYYSNLFSAAATAPGSTDSDDRIPALPITRFAKRVLPATVYSALRECWSSVRRRLPGSSTARKPWGLKRWRTLG